MINSADRSCSLHSIFQISNFLFSSLWMFCRKPLSHISPSLEISDGNDAVTLIKGEMKQAQPGERRLWELPDKHTSYGAPINIIASLLRWSGIKAVNLGLLFLSSLMEHFPGHKRPNDRNPVMNEAAVALRRRRYSQILSLRRQKQQ